MEVGKAYKVRLTSGAWVQAVFLSQETYTAGMIRQRTRYQFRNLASGRTITLKSLVKIRQIGGAL